MTKCKVRKGFVVWIGESKHYIADEEIDLTDEQYQKVKHQVELVTSKRTAKSTTKEASE